MKMKSFLFVLCVVSFSVLPLVYADELPSEPSVDVSGSVRSLYASAEKLSLGNSVLAVHLNEINMKVAALQLRLKQLLMDNERLSQEALNLQDNDPSRAKKITALEKESFDMDAKIEELRGKIKADADALALAPAQESRYDQRLAEIGAVSKPVDDPVIESNASEKLRLLKYIRESKKKQEDLYAKIIAGKVSVPVVRVESSAQKNALLASIRVLEDEIGQLKKMSSLSVAKANDSQQLKELQAQVAMLQKNYDVLEGLEARLQQKSQVMQKNVEQHGEYARLKENLAQLNKDNTLYLMQIKDLRVQMVELDKRKTLLEALVRK